MGLEGKMGYALTQTCVFRTLGSDMQLDRRLFSELCKSNLSQITVPSILGRGH